MCCVVVLQTSSKGCEWYKNLLLSRLLLEYLSLSRLGITSRLIPPEHQRSDGHQQQKIQSSDSVVLLL